MTSCPEHDVMDRFVGGSASRRERREVVRHLLAGCGRCAALLREAFRPAVQERDDDEALARSGSGLIPAQAGCP
jgi:hypothetical protein